MTISNKDLLLAILGMDAYNHGYGLGINHGNNNIGSATKGVDSSLLVDQDNVPLHEDAGFYAISYDTDFGTVISYRGTDFPPDEQLR